MYYNLFDCYPIDVHLDYFKGFANINTATMNILYTYLHTSERECMCVHSTFLNLKFLGEWIYALHFFNPFILFYLFTYLFFLLVGG